LGLGMRIFLDVRTHKKQLCCLHTAEVAGSNPASPTRQKQYFAG
jgi:hypothetical protein